MKRRLTLSKETLRTLDAQELAMVVGGSDSHHPGHPSGANGSSCPGSFKESCPNWTKGAHCHH